MASKRLSSLSIGQWMSITSIVSGDYKLEGVCLCSCRQLDYESTPLSLSLLASHLFFRALSTVPSLIRKWLLDCTDRQLSSSVVSYTSQYFSPVIIRTELAHVKSPEAAELADENMTIKVAQSVNEVTASYLVDEHQLEITLKMPSDWPLHTIEIKDFKKVGVLEDRWRAWVLGVQQIIWSQVGNTAILIALLKCFSRMDAS